MTTHQHALPSIIPMPSRLIKAVPIIECDGLTTDDLAPTTVILLKGIACKLSLAEHLAVQRAFRNWIGSYVLLAFAAAVAVFGYRWLV